MELERCGSSIRNDLRMGRENVKGIFEKEKTEVPLTIEKIVEKKCEPILEMVKNNIITKEQFSILKDQIGVTELFRVNRVPGERIVGFMGSARTPSTDPEYGMIKGLAKTLGEDGFSILTGAGPGLMEAASYGGKDAGTKVYGIRIRLPFEQETNDAVDPKLLTYCDNFAPRFQGLIYNSDAIIVGRGGLGTLEELMYAITEMQTGKMPLKPLVLMGEQYRGLVNIMEKMKEEGTISKHDVSLVNLVDAPEKAEKIVKQFYRHFDSIQKGENETSLIIKLNKRIDPKFENILPSSERFETAFDQKQNKSLCTVINGEKTGMLVLNANIRNIGVVRELIDFINNQPEKNGVIIPSAEFWRKAIKKLSKYRAFTSNANNGASHHVTTNPDDLKTVHGGEQIKEYSKVLKHLKTERD